MLMVSKLFPSSTVNSVLIAFIIYDSLIITCLLQESKILFYFKTEL